jgi:hypothetical protein
VLSVGRETAFEIHGGGADLAPALRAGDQD